MLFAFTAFYDMHLHSSKSNFDCFLKKGERNGHQKGKRAGS